MRNCLRQNSGYSLLSVLLIITMVSTIGLTLMGLTTNSLKFVSANKTSVEDKASAEMAVEEAMAQIDNMVASVNTEISSNRLLMDSVKTKVQTSLDQIKSSTHPFTITHSALKNGEDGVYREKVSIDAPLGNSGKHLFKTITISTIANVFKYTTVTPGSLTLNGASYIEGDVSVGGNIKLSNYGKFLVNYIFSSQYFQVPTSYPAIKGSLSVSGKYFQGNSTQWNSFSPSPENINRYFSISPILKEETINVDTFNIVSLVNQKDKNLDPNNRLPYYFWNELSSNQTLDARKVEHFHIYKNTTVHITGNLIVGDLTMEDGAKLTVDGSIFVYGLATLKGSLTTTNPNNYIFINGYTNINTLNLDGKMYINNSVYIQNDLNTNGTIYVSGNAKIQSLSNTSSGTLVLLTDGNIELSNNNEFNDAPKTINAFFYSNSQLEIYGVGSNLKIVGGIYGNPIILNAVKGKTKESSFEGSFSVGSDYKLYFQNNQNSIEASKSRLSIIYQKDLILNPPKGIPTVEQLSVKEIDEVYK